MVQKQRLQTATCWIRSQATNPVSIFHVKSSSSSRAKDGNTDLETVTKPGTPSPKRLQRPKRQSNAPIRPPPPPPPPPATQRMLLAPRTPGIPLSQSESPGIPSAGRGGCCAHARPGIGFRRAALQMAGRKSRGWR